MWALCICALLVAVLLLRWARSGRGLNEYLGLALVRGYARLWHGCWSARPVPLPPKGAAILVANHTCSADASFLQAHSGRVLGFLMAREFYGIFPGLGAIFDYMGCVQVNRRQADIRSVRVALRRLGEGGTLCVFPEGGLSGAGRKRIRRGKCGVALLALRSGAPVFPVFIDGGPQHPSVKRAWLWPSRARLYPGQAVDLAEFRGRKINRQLLEQTTAFIMQQIGALQPRRRDRHSHLETRRNP